MPDKALYCIDSWRKHLPDYQLRLWDEDAFDLNNVLYVKQAYEARKFAFVTDYVRLYALYHEGGIYMDTDVEILKSLNTLLHLPGFSGFESPTELPTGIMATEFNNEWAGEQLNYYTDRSFRNPDNTFDYTTNVEIISATMQAQGILLNNTYQVYNKCMHFFPKDYFCPKERSGRIRLTENTYCIHHFEGSWQPKSQQIKRFIFRKVIGPTLTERLIWTKQKLKAFF